MTKPSPIEFWFDFSSPYGYLASTQIDGLAEDHGRATLWRPFLLGVIFGITKQTPLETVPMKGAYMDYDVKRLGRLYGVGYTHPDPFPVSSVAASRAFYWLERRDREKAKLFAAVVFDALFDKGRPINDPAVLLDIASHMGVDRGAMAAGMRDPALKDELRGVVDEAKEREIFGSPFFIVDGEKFWGFDRLWMVEEWLETGGW